MSNRDSKRDPHGDEPFEVTVTLLNETDRAILVTDDGKSKIWLPKSQIDSHDWERGKVYTITMPMWLVKEKGLDKIAEPKKD